MSIYKTTQVIAESYGYPNLLESPKDEALSNEVCREVCEWMKVHQSREPSTTSVDSVEKYFGVWVSHKRKDKKGTGSPFFISNQNIAESYGYPALFNSLEERSNRKCLEVCRWIIAHGRPPSCKASNEDERDFGVWLQFRKTAKKRNGNWKFYSSDQAIAESHNLSDLFKISDDEPLSNKMCQEICEWMREHRREPSASSKDSNEKVYGTWIGHRRKEKKLGKIYTSNQVIVASFGYSDLFDSLEERSNKVCHELCAWMKGHGRKPNKNRKEEKYLGQWLGQRRQNKKGTGSPFYTSNQVIAESYGYSDLFEVQDKEKLSNETCHNLCRWVKRYTKIPSSFSSSEDERKLGKWLSHKRDNKKGEKKLFYSSDQNIAESYGYPALFETRGKI